jgi:hypothetical protein
MECSARIIRVSPIPTIVMDIRPWEVVDITVSGYMMPIQGN